MKEEETGKGPPPLQLLAPPPFDTPEELDRKIKLGFTTATNELEPLNLLLEIKVFKAQILDILVS